MGSWSGWVKRARMVMVGRLREMGRLRLEAADWRPPLLALQANRPALEKLVQELSERLELLAPPE
jgi:hypothetical protein